MNAITDSGDDSRPQIVTDGAGNWVSVWDSIEDLNSTSSTDVDIFVSRSSDNGATWSAPAHLNSDANTDTGQDRRPILATDGAGVWITVWEGDGDGGDLDVYYARSTDNGATWSARALLSPWGDTDDFDDAIPDITTDRNGNWVAVWDMNGELDNSGFDRDIVVTRSTNAGVSWSTPALLNTNATTDNGDDFRVQVRTDRDGNWVTIWQSNDDLSGNIEDFDLFSASSSNNGVTWSAPVLLNSNGATDAGDDMRPGFETDLNGNWIAVWSANANLNGETGTDQDIFFSRSTNNGASWSAMALVNQNGETDFGTDEFPRITSDHYRNWIVSWNSEEDLNNQSGGDWDIFYSRSVNNGTTWSGPAILNTNANDDSNVDLVPQTANDGVGNWVAVWESNEPIETSGFDYDIIVSRFFIDAIAPEAITITPQTVGPTNAASVNFTVTFNEVVTGFNNASDVVVSHTGTANSGVNISGGPQTYTVAVTGLSGTGSFTLAVANNSDVVDGAGNPLEDSVTSASVSIDRDAPTITLASAAANPVNGAIGVTATLSESSANFASGDISPSNASVSNFSGSGTSYSFTLTPSGEGSFSAVVNASTFTDAIGNNNTASNTLSRTADFTAPTIALSSAAANPINGAITVSVAISESVSNFAAGDISTVNGTVSNFSGSGDAYSFTLTPDDDGTFSATVNAATFTDAATNANTASNTLSRTADLTDPQIVLSSSAPNPTNAAITVSVALSESSANFAAGDIDATNGTVSNFSGSGASYSFTLTPDNDGSFSASVDAGSFTDAGGNGNEASNTLSRTADLTDPTIVLSSSAADPVNAAITVTATLSESSSNFASGDISTVNGAVSNFSGSGTSYSFTLTPSAGGTFSATVDADGFTDAATNGNEASNTLSRTADLTPPTIALSSAAANPINGAITVSVVISESVSNFVAGDISTVNSTVSNFSGSGDTYSFTLTPDDDGIFSATVNASTFTDAATNANTASNTLSRTADLTDPTIVLSSSAANPTNAAITVTVALSESSANFAAGDIGATNGTVSNFSGSGTSYSFTLTPDDDGSFSASVNAGTFTDTAGNGNEASNTLSRTADLTDPTIVLSSSAADPINGAISVTATLSESSANFAAGDVSAVNGTVSGFSGSGSSYSFTLTPSAGGAFSATVNAGAFTDTATNGNEASNTLSRTADLTAPTVVLSSSAANPINGAISVTVALSESSTTFVAGDVATANSTLSNFSGSGASYSFTLTPDDDGSFSATVNASSFTDAAGNNNTVSNTLSRTADLTDPGIVLSSAAANPINGAISVTATLTESSTTFAAGDVSTVNATVSNFSGSGASYSFTLTPSAEGTFSATVDASTFTDASGNNNTVSNTLSRTADLTVPTIALSSSAADPINGAISVTATLSESSTNFAAGDVSTVNALVSNFSGSGASYSFTLTPSASGTFSATVNASTFTDAAGNNNTASNSLSRTGDLTVPSVSMSSTASNPTTNVTIPVTVTFSESVTGFTSGDISASGATVNNFAGSGADYTFDLVATGAGTVTANIASGVATDSAGNGNTAATQFSRTFNVAPLINLIDDVTVSDGSSYSVTPTLVEGTGPITWTLTAPVSAPSDMAINASTGEVTWTASYFFNPVDVTITATGPGGSDSESWRITVLPPPIWVDFAYTGVEVGTNAQPFNTLAEAVAAADPNATIRIKGNTALDSTNETLMILTPMRLEASGGAVRIGGSFGGGGVQAGGSVEVGQNQTGFVTRN